MQPITSTTKCWSCIDSTPQAGKAHLAALLRHSAHPSHKQYDEPYSCEGWTAILPLHLRLLTSRRDDMTRQEPRASLHVSLTIVQLLRRLKSRLTGCLTRRAPGCISESCALKSNAIWLLQPSIAKASLHLHGRRQLKGCQLRIRRRRKGRRAAGARRCTALSVQQYVVFFRQTSPLEVMILNHAPACLTAWTLMEILAQKNDSALFAQTAAYSCE